MADNSITIHITDDHMHLNLGGILDSHLEYIREKDINYVTISVANDILYGNFSIPTAVGFSTTATLLKGGIITLSHNDIRFEPFKNPCASDDKARHDSKFDVTTRNIFLEQFNDWLSIYSKTGTRIIKSHVITHDKLSCVMCGLSYKLDDKLYVIDNCGHQCHLQCLKERMLNECEVCEPHIKKEIMHYLHTSISINNTVVCPVCQVKSRI